MSASAADRLRARVEERAVEVQATVAEAAKTGDALLDYDRRENERHLILRHADERTADIVERQLLAGDIAEAALLRSLRDRLTHIGTESYELAGDLTRLMELRRSGQAELFPQERAS